MVSARGDPAIAGLPEGAATEEAALAMAKALGLEVIAEGIEQQAQRDFLMAAGCDTGQGFLVSPAVPAAELTLFLAKCNTTVEC